MDEKKAIWTTNSMDDLNFVASQGSQNFQHYGVVRNLKNPSQAH